MLNPLLEPTQKGSKRLARRGLGSRQSKHRVVRIVVASEARDDPAEAAGYIAKDNPTAAARLRMKADKRRRLEAHGWKFGSAKDFLGLTDEEAEYIELQLSLAALLRKRRESLGYTQTEVADLIGSSQSRVAKMEAGDPSVSVDLLIRTLLALGVNRKQVGRAIGAASSA